MNRLKGLFTFIFEVREDSMSQFLIYGLTALGTAVFDLIDSAFGNNLGIDSICVMSSVIVITWCMGVAGNLGRFAFDVKQSCVADCAVLQLIASVVVGGIVWVLQGVIPHVYSLTAVQYALMQKCLAVYAIFFPIKSMACFFRNVVACQSRIKLHCGITVIFYSIMIALDVLVIVCNGECYHLVLTTGISYTVMLILYLVLAKALAGIGKPSLTGIMGVWCCAKEVLCERVLGKVTTVAFGALASRLGTRNYALHSIAYSLAVGTEYVTSEWQRMQLITLKGTEVLYKKWQQCKSLGKKMFVPGIVMCYLSVLVLIIPLHGECDLVDSFWFSCLYSTQCFAMALFENSRGFLMSAGQTGMLKCGSLIGILIRIPIALLGAFTPLGIYAFAFASFIDYALRGLFFVHVAKHLCGSKV